MKGETRRSGGTKHEEMKKTIRAVHRLLKLFVRPEPFPGGQKAIVPFSTTSTAFSSSTSIPVEK